MDKNRAGLLGRLWAEGRAFDAGQEDRLNRRRNLEPESAQLLNLLVRSISPSAVLELGTSNGYSTVWIADALEATDGHLVTVEYDEGRAAEAARNLAAAKVADRVEQRVDDAGRVLASEAAEAWSVVFLDAERPAYTSYWPDLCRILAPGGLLVVDNCISHADQVVDFRALVAATPGYRSSLLPVGAGLLLIGKDRLVDER